MTVAFLFPGQGAQVVGMGQDLYKHDEAARQVFDSASEALDLDVPKLCFEDPDELLNVTEYTQPLLLTACVAAFAAFVKRYPQVSPSLLAGLSLGEYAALVAGGALDFPEAVRLVRLRGRYMQGAVPRGTGGMAAVVGLSSEEVERLCGEISTLETWVEPANYNCPGQIAVAGHLPAVKAFCQAAKAAGANRAVPLPVSAPFHNRLLRPAGEQLAHALGQVFLNELRIPLVNNVAAEPVTASAAIRDGLIRQVYSPVKMEQSLRFMLDRGVRAFIEFGPGQTMSKFVQRLDQTAQVFNVSDVEGLIAVGEVLPQLPPSSV